MKVTEQQKSRMMVSGFIGAVLMVIVVYFHFMIGRSQVNEMKRRDAKLTTEIADARKELKEIQALLSQKSELDRQREILHKVVQRLPSSPDAPGFLNELVGALRKTGIIQEFVKPAPPQDRSQYTEIPYTIEAHGRYHELGQFLTLIEQNPQRFMRIKKFSVDNNLARPSVHPIEMEIGTFMFNK